MPPQRRARCQPRAVVSAGTLAQIAAKPSELGLRAEAAQALLAPFHLVVVPLDEATAFATGVLQAAQQGLGFSLDERACLTVAAKQSAMVMTRDKAWASLNESFGASVALML